MGRPVNVMMIHGIPEDQLERIHWYHGPGKGSSYAYKHLPSGIVAGGRKPPAMKTHEFDRQLLAELVEKLKAAGILSTTERGGE